MALFSVFWATSTSRNGRRFWRSRSGARKAGLPTLQMFEWNFNYKRSVENGIDPAHNEFVHPTHGMKGMNENYRVRKLDMRETDWGTGFFNKVYAPPLAEKKMREASGEHNNRVIKVGTGHHGPASVWTFINPTPEMHIYQYLYEAPVDEENTRLFLINMRNFMQEDIYDETMMERNQYVAMQDRKVLYDLHPKITPRVNTKELFHSLGLSHRALSGTAQGMGSARLANRSGQGSRA